MASYVMFQTGNVSDLDNWNKISPASIENKYTEVGLITGQVLSNFTLIDSTSIIGFAIRLYANRLVTVKLKKDTTVIYETTVLLTGRRLPFFLVDLTLTPGDYSIEAEAPEATEYIGYSSLTLLVLDEHPTSLDDDQLYIVSPVTDNILATWDITDSTARNLFLSADLIFASSNDYNLTLNERLNYGTISAGSSTVDYPLGSTATITLGIGNINTAYEIKEKLGNLQFYGLTKTTYTTLTGSATGDSIQVETLTGWQIGDTLIIGSNVPGQLAESFNIVSISGHIIELSGNLAHSRVTGTLVANTSKNIKILASGGSVLSDKLVGNIDGTYINNVSFVDTGVVNLTNSILSGNNSNYMDSVFTNCYIVNSILTIYRFTMTNIGMSYTGLNCRLGPNNFEGIVADNSNFILLSDTSIKNSRMAYGSTPALSMNLRESNLGLYRITITCENLTLKEFGDYNISINALCIFNATNLKSQDAVIADILITNNLFCSNLSELDFSGAQYCFHFIDAGVIQSEIYNSTLSSTVELIKFENTNHVELKISNSTTSDAAPTLNTLTKESYIAFENSDNFGSIVRNGKIVGSKLYPIGQAEYTELGIIVYPGDDPFFAIDVATSGDYVGDAPEVILKKNLSLGVEEDTVIINTLGTNLAGHLPASTNYGVQKLAVRANGTAGYVTINNFTSTVTGRNDRNFDILDNGYPSSVVGYNPSTVLNKGTPGVFQVQAKFSVTTAKTLLLLQSTNESTLKIIDINVTCLTSSNSIAKFGIYDVLNYEQAAGTEIIPTMINGSLDTPNVKCFSDLTIEPAYNLPYDISNVPLWSGYRPSSNRVIVSQIQTIGLRLLETPDAPFTCICTITYNEIGG